ncbi:MAG: TAT-variant-translocated molybdopterin oxidoreductase [Chlorobi bacterium]|nr:TAT-variant-translocated molybdopterin oxidoreductase [Chlorobiota bacterium]MCI0716433.1 TAT-variant-translocated molybdopterin oxidoreductase [Chlorobiota bacterium]
MDKGKLNISNMIIENGPEAKREDSEDLVEQALNKTYWRSFKELYNDPDFKDAVKYEFTKESEEKPDLSKLSGISRRRFLALMSASAALAAAGCSNYKDKGLVIAYNQKPEEVVLGLPNYYASACTGCGSACGILVKTREGRPIKIDGNPDHPVSKGKICTKGQASIMNLYNPERLREPMFNKLQTSWDEANKNIVNELKSASSSGKEIAIITHSVLSPSLKKLLDEFKVTYPTAKIYSYEVFNDTPKQNAWFKSYGKRTIPALQLDKAKVILALESDFLGNELNQIENTRLYSQTRDVMSKNEFSRLYAVEGAVTLTGTNADYRIRLRTDAIEEFVICILNELVNRKKVSAFAADSRVTSVLASYNLNDFAAKYYLDLKSLNQLIEDLTKHQGEGIILAGDKLPESTHIAANLLNEVLGNTKLYSSESENVELMPLSTNDELSALDDNMQKGGVGVVIHFDTNPVFHFSPDYNYAEALKKVHTVVTLTEEISESAELSGYVLPINDPLESWGDFKTRTGFYSLQQPIIAPLYNTRQKEAILLNWKDLEKPYNEKIYNDYIRENWEKNLYPVFGSLAPFNKFWLTILHDGVALVNEKSESAGTFSTGAFAESSRMKAGSDFIVLLQNNNSVGDGRFASNGWLQELPNPITKTVWDNYAALSPQAASEIGVNSNDLVEITLGSKKQTLPVFVQPGLADKVIEISLGYGRTAAGAVGTGVGVNANVLISKAPAITERFYNNAQITKVSGTYEIASTQEHYPIDSDPLLKDIQYKRGIIREGTYEEYKTNPKFLKEKEGRLNLQPINKPPVYESKDYTGYKWGMAIDLNKCTGCGACITACNVENNIPIVGKDQVIVNREMMWIRLDRYYSGTPDAPKTSYQPMLCQHCDYAPCENVCPVVATTHSNDGLNAMAYNRCVGTRYCSNNCPYKVRRFNYFDFRDHFRDSIQYAEPLDLLANPEVTVRSRGIMEKCTFCIQRIMKERQDAIQENRKVIGSNVKTACQEACPAYAIVFGDVNDKESEIAKYREHELAYSVLEEIKVLPNVTYIAKLRNVLEESK